MKTAYLYTLVRKRDSKVIYAGVTRYPHKRHLYLDEGLGMVILRSCPLKRAYRIEKQIIAAYQRRNECKRNVKRKTPAQIESARKKRLLGTKYFSVSNVPVELYDKLKERAETERRSFSSLVLLILESST